MNRYLQKMCRELAITLKRQRGDQYGFGDDPSSPMDVRKNMTDSMLDDSDATHTKPIENYFGNFDRELKQSGPQGFDKATSDLIIKYSKDLLDGEHLWHTRANRKAAKILEIKQKNFDEKQEELVKCGVDEIDASNICSENKVIKCISECKKAHGGPITETTDLHKLVQNISDEKKLNTSLNLEIRL